MCERVLYQSGRYREEEEGRQSSSWSCFARRSGSEALRSEMEEVKQYL